MRLWTTRFLYRGVMWTLLVAGWVLPLHAQSPQPKETGRPNILWLTAEDIGPQFSFYGDTTVATPRLAELAQRGMVVDAAWSNYPVCAPARTTLITGMYAASNGAGNMRSTAKLPPGIRMFPQWLREAGYYCTNNSKEDYNHPKPGRVWDASSGKAHYRDREPGQPFFAVFNHTGTHESRIRTRPHTAVLDPQAVTLPAYWPDTPEVRQDWAQYYDNLVRLDHWIGDRLDELEAAGEADRTIVFFFGDHGSGMPRHKRYAGDSGMRVPLLVYVPPGLQHLAPEDYLPSGHSARPVGFVDLAPTMLSLAGIEPPSTMQGRAWMGASAVAPDRYLLGLRSRMDERIDLSRSLRDDRFVYIRNFLPHLPAGQVLDYQMQTPTTAIWKQMYDAGQLDAVQSAFWERRAAEELYDLTVDPQETVNLAADPEHAAVRDRFREALRERLQKIDDSGFVPESELARIRQETTVREYCQDRDRYPFEAIYEMAVAASAGEPDSLPLLQSGLEAEHPVLRFWAVTGLLIRGPDAIAPEAERLASLLQDPSAAVAIAAAEALARFGPDSNRELARERLVHFADLRHESFFAAVEALNALDRLGDLPEETRMRLGELPTNDPAIRRSGDNVQRLLTHLLGSR